MCCKSDIIYVIVLPNVLTTGEKSFLIKILVSRITIAKTLISFGKWQLYVKHRLNTFTKMFENSSFFAHDFFLFSAVQRIIVRMCVFWGVVCSETQTLCHRECVLPVMAYKISNSKLCVRYTFNAVYKEPNTQYKRTIHTTLCTELCLCHTIRRL